MFHHILVPLDGSTCAEQALPMATRVARASGATLTLLYVLHYRPEYLPSTMPTGMLTQEALDTDRQYASDYLSRMTTNSLLKGIPLKTKIMYGSPAGSITDNNQLEHADLIIMCSHGHTGFKRFILGSIAQQVARHSTIPVLILHEQKDDQHIEENIQQPFRILVALDGSTQSEAVIKPAASLSAYLSAPQPGNLHLIRIVRPILTINPGQIETAAQLNKEAYDMARAYLQDVTRKIFLHIASGLPVQVSSSVRCDDNVPERLLTTANLAQIMDTPPLSAIAMTTHGRHGIPRWLLGSVTEYVLGHTTLPLLVLRQIEGTSSEKAAPEEQTKSNDSAKNQHEQEQYQPFITF